MAQPSWLLVLASLAVIGSALALPCMFIVACATEPFNPIHVAVAAVAAPLSLLVALQQYRGTFRRVSSAAMLVGNLLFGLAAFTAFGLVANLGESVVAGDSLDTMLSLGTIMLLVILVSGGIGALNTAWARKLTRDSWSDAEGGERRGVSLRELLLGMGTAAVMVGMTAHAVRTAPPVAGEHFAAADAPVNVPADATDVCFARGMQGNAAFEFAIDEEGFRRWAASIAQQGEAAPLERLAISVAVDRYVSYAPQFSGTPNVTVNDGLYFDVTMRGRGGYVVYDRATQRAYYESR